MRNLGRLRKMRHRQSTQSICLTAHTGKVLHLLHSTPSPYAQGSTPGAWGMRPTFA